MRRKGARKKNDRTDFRAASHKAFRWASESGKLCSVLLPDVISEIRKSEHLSYSSN